MIDKIDLLKRKIAQQYDEDFYIDGIVPTEDEFNQMADRVRTSSKFTYTDAEFLAARDQIRETRVASLGLVLSIDDKNDDHDLNWFDKFRTENPTRNEYNHRFEMYMTEEKNWSSDNIKELNRNTDEIVNRLGDPNKSGPWKRKGLVIGDVQSGKTVNYTSICNKAVDAGYKIIIILAGRTNTLRRQTQKRLESDCVGVRKDDANRKKGEALPTTTVGVGLYGDCGMYQLEAITSNVTDFSIKVADAQAITFNDHMMPRLFVIKKNVNVLTNLWKWFGGEQNKKLNVPMLLIDDEADDASINTKDNQNPTAINMGIRRILKIFTRSTYLAVTATPFANIFIDPYIDGTDTIDPDLFPDNFISCLPTPDPYIGSEKMFRDDEYKGYVIPIKSDEVKAAFPFGHKKTQTINVLPDSLKTAIRYFILTNAVRDILGHSKTHRSMMINISRFVDVQNRLKSQVLNFWEDQVFLDIKSYSKLGSEGLTNSSELQELKRLYEYYALQEKYSVDWETVQATLFESNKTVKIYSINQKSADSLDYDRYEKENNDGLRVIAIGGDCLSRGLTLEGLCVSYFYRNSKMYDTLMQMGRWFGYRPGYDKLVKVWMADEAVAWYTHISDATEALKREVFTMNRNDLTPLDFGYKIKGHPDALIPTAKAKMKNAKLNVDYLDVDVAGKLIECPRLFDNKEKLQSNRKVADDFISKISQYAQFTDNGSDLSFKSVKASDVAEFIQLFRTKLWNYYFESSSLSSTIETNGGLWNVFIKNGDNKPDYTVVLSNGEKYPIGAQKRTSTWDNGEIKVSGTKVKVGTGGCTAIGLKDGITMSDVRSKWQELEESISKKSGKHKEVPDDYILHEFVDTPMLIIHNILLQKEEQDGNGNKHTENYTDDANDIVLAISLGFPSEKNYKESKNGANKPTKIRVYLNKVAQELEAEEGDDYVDENM